MPVQLFPNGTYSSQDGSGPSTPPPRSSLLMRIWKSPWFRWPVRGVAVLTLTVAAVGSSPLLLLNTATGRRVLIGAANSGEEGHLGLKGSSLTYLPSVGLVLEGMRLTQPFEPLAPRVSMQRFELSDLSVESSLPGTPLVCKVAHLEGISMEVHQIWVQQKQKDARPPSLPEPFPSQLRTEVVVLKDVDYVVHQTRRGRPVRMELTGIEATLRDFRWDFKEMKVEGQGPLSAARLNLNGMPFTELHIPEFRATGNTLELPQGTLVGMGGQVSFSGKLVLQQGIPMPDFQVQVSGLNLNEVIDAAPDPAPPGPRPDAKVSMRAHVTAGSPDKPGEVADPVLDGDVVLEDFRVPLVKQSALALKILERMPGYIPATDSSPARLDLGTFRSHVRIADGEVALRNGSMSFGPLSLAMEGTIEQGSGKLDLRLWLERGAGAESTDKSKDDQSKDSQSSDNNGKGPGLLAKLAEKKDKAGARGAEQTAAKSDPSQEKAATTDKAAATAGNPSQGSSTPGIAQSKEGGSGAQSPDAAAARDDGKSLREKFLAKKHEVDSAVLEKKKEVDTAVAAKAAEVKADVEARLEEAKTKAQNDVTAAKKAIDTRVAETKDAIEGGPEAIKSLMDKRTQEMKSRVDEKVAEMKANIDAGLARFQDALMDRLEEKLGRPTLCITGTTAQPVINPCSDPSGGK